MPDPTQSFADYLTIFRRRRLLISLVGIGLFLIAVLVALLWPPTYRSTATILIIEQEVPTDFVRSTITSYADQQIERIKAQVMTRSRLFPLIEENGLYKDLRKRNTSVVAVKEFIEDITIEVMSAEVVDRRTGRPTEATIAFTLAYEGPTPGLTQKVANELTTLFLNENLKNREEQVQQATAFLKQESEKLATSLSQFEGEIAEFKNKAGGALPELFQMNMQLLNQVERELIEKNQQAQAQEERIVYLEGELARRDGEMKQQGGPKASSLREQLKTLRHQYASMASHLSQEHPDIIKLKGEIEALEGQVDDPIRGGELSEELKTEEMKLAKLLERYGDEHPDVMRTRKTIALLKEQTTDLPASPTEEDETFFDPVYVTLTTQLASAKSNLAHIRTSQKQLEKRMREYAARVERTPEIEPAYQTLIRERDNSAKKFQEYRSRLLEAQVAEGLELERKGERFSLVDPPSLPEEPVRPNRRALLFLGFVLALAGGIGSAALAESMDSSIHSVGRLQELTQLAPLSVIPYLSTLQEHKIRIRNRRLLGLGALVLALGSLTLVHIFWLPLDVIWYAALRKLRIS